jgi:Putative Tad-like Flp pilus-assembly
MALTFVACGLLIGSYAVDVTNLEQQRTLMQVTADSVAHDALLTRELRPVDEAVEAAVARAEAMMPEETYGAILDEADILFGSWNAETRTFTPNPTSRSAVRVLLRRTSDNDNPIATYLFRMIGLDNFDVVVRSTFAIYQPFCLREGFVAQGVVDIQSNNSYLRRFCIHANNHVKLSSNNYFEAGTVVSMPDLDLLELPKSGFKTNIGLADALREGSMNIRVLKRISDIIATVDEPDSRYYPSFITSSVPITITKKKITAADILPGRIYNWNCSGGPGGTVDNGAVLKNALIIANCDVTLGKGSAMENAILATTSTSDKSVKSPDGFRLGVKDGCTPGGGGRIVTMGGMDFAAKLQIYGSQMLAMKDVAFSAQANGIEGASIISNEDISGTSNMSMSYCGGGMDEFTADYFQMVD